MKQVTTMYDTEWLLKNENIQHCINTCIDQNGKIDYATFYYHWANYELTYSLGWLPSNKQIKMLVSCVNATGLPKNYHGPWWPKVKAVIEEGASNPRIWGQTVDRFTCSMIYNVVTKLNENNQKKIKEMDFPVAHHVVMSFYEDQRAGKV